MGSILAASAIVLGITGGWVYLVQLLFPVRTKWRVISLALALGALSPLPLLLLFHLREKVSLPDNPGLGDAFRISLTMAGLPEEFVKSVAVVAALLLLRHFSVFHQRIDRATAFRLPVLCGLAFAAVENIGYSVNSTVTTMVNNEIGNPLIVPLVRSLAASLLHASLGCLMGFFFARTAENDRIDWGALLLGFVAAVAGHTAVDWGLIVPVLTILDRGQDLDESEISAMAPHFLLALVLIPSVIAAAIIGTIAIRRRIKRAFAQAQAF